MKRNCCPACGGYMRRIHKLDYDNRPRPYDRCLNAACGEASWDAAITRQQWTEAERRNRVWRAEKAVAS